MTTPETPPTPEVPVVEPNRDADAVGAPPYALPEDQGGSAAVVGHPEPPATLAESPVGPSTDSAEVTSPAADPVTEPVVPGPDDAPAEPPTTEV